MYLDLSWRLATGHSPMEISRFRCEHPEDPDKCLTYGSVDQLGAVIEVDRDPSRHYLPVLLLFIPPVEHPKKQ